MNYMLSSEERIYLGRRNRQIRTSKKIFTVDFFNDAPMWEDVFPGNITVI